MTIIDLESARRLLPFLTTWGGFLFLLCEIRFEHRGVLVDDWRPWIPLLFCGLMCFSMPVAAIRGKRAGRIVLMSLFAFSVLLGLAGCLFHSEGHFIARVVEIVSVWSSSLRSGAEIKAVHPPLLAPLALAGLGFIGIIFCFDNRAEFREKLVGREEP